MISCSVEKTLIEVNFLGRFSASLGKVPLFKNAERSRQVISLFAFLLLNRFENISQERITEALWPEDKSDDPVNALKNLVYRLRKIISAHGNLDGNDCVISKNGTYAWNCEIPCIIDAEEMEKLWRQANDEKLPVSTRIELYKRAISLYKGRFLEDLYFEGWAAPMSSYYQSIYMNCIHEVSNLLNIEMLATAMLRYAADCTNIMMNANPLCARYLSIPMRIIPLITACYSRF